MPSKLIQGVRPPALILVTGANGFIASHVVFQLLQEGYQVLGTVRTEEKATAVRNVHTQQPKLTVCVVKDITSAQEYTNSIELSKPQDQPLEAIIHLAAPFSYSVTDFEQDLLQPAVQGTEAILNVAQHFQVQVVVHTNSFACIYDAAAGPSPEKTYRSKDWSPLTYEDGLNAPNAPTAYRAAKTVAEKTAWEWVEKRAESLSFGIVSLCPAMVFGPFLPGAEPSSIQALNESNKLVWDVVRQGEAGNIPPTKAPVWVDVRDVAKAHLQAVTDSGLTGQRLLLAAGVYCNQEIADAAREACPQLKSKVPVGEPGKREAASHFGVDTIREMEMLRMKWTSLQECLGDVVPQLFEIEARSGHATI